ncbi:acyl-CoA synthetase [Rhodovibrionaceae bacterium A322]
MSFVFDIAAKRAELNPDKVALTELASGEKLTFRALNARAEGCARAFLTQGLVAGDRVAILCHNRSAFFEILFACAKARLVLVPLNWRLTPAELSPLLQDCGATVLLHDAPTAELAVSLGSLVGADAEASDVTLVPISEANQQAPYGSYQALRNVGMEAQALEPTSFDTLWPSDGLWYLLYTSGTTGVPKAVKQTFGMAYANATNIGQPMSLCETDVTPNFLPLFHTAGINLLTLPTLMVGGSVEVLPGFDLDLFFDLISDSVITALLAVPTVYQLLAQHPRFEETDLTSVRHWSSGGAPLPNSLVDLYGQRGVTICQGYGMTETGPTVFLMDEASVPKKLGSVGRAQLLAEVKVVDGQGLDVPAGEAGELLVRGPGVTPGYWNRPAANAETFTPEGWLKTGDVARRDAEGYVYIVDRIKDLYISGGENVYPAEVEKVLLAHPGVLEASVLGIPDTKWGEVGCAFVQAREGAELSAESLRKHCKAQLASYKIPKIFRFCRDYPRTPAGKIQKHLLKAQYLKEGLLAEGMIRD